MAKEVLESMVPKHWPIHMHGFTNSWKICQFWAKDWPNMKFGLVSDKFDPEIIRKLPLNRILLETDAPYFHPLRAQSFTSSMADLRQDRNRVSSFSRSLNGMFT